MPTLPSLHQQLSDTLAAHFERDLLGKWYPLVVDGQQGGYFTNLEHDWTLSPRQEKMIVTQSRHIWTASKAAGFVADGSPYVQIARHGMAFLKDHMWDHSYGGFYQIRSRDGQSSDVCGWRDEKRTYGVAFAIFALAALHRQTGDREALDLATDAFRWLEEHAYDLRHHGYFQFLTREGEAFHKGSRYQTIASDRNELGYKDQNSSIHLLEAYTELYQVWKDEGLRERLYQLLVLIRDTMVGEKGYLSLFFEPDWTPVSFREAPPEVRAANYGLDHVSFCHDCETAFLMLEASHTLGIENDARTLSIARRMIEHAVLNGWDQQHGGFFDGGVFEGSSRHCAIVRRRKTWWGQAEALNALLLFSAIFPHDTEYLALFEKEWEYIDRYVLDHDHGDWHEGGLDQEPDLRTAPKSHIWKCTYHTGRALMNCIALLTDDDGLTPGARERRKALESFITHWKKT
jgi:mannobiose 2-epimerase